MRCRTMSISRVGNPSCPPHQLQRIVRRVQSFARFDQTPKRREVGLQPSVPTSPLIAGITILGNLLRNVVVARPLETLDCNPPAVTATRGIRAPNLSHRVRRWLLFLLQLLPRQGFGPRVVRLRPVCRNQRLAVVGRQLVKVVRPNACVPLARCKSRH